MSGSASRFVCRMSFTTFTILRQVFSTGVSALQQLIGERSSSWSRRPIGSMPGK
jgi:hypothetical protein